MSRVAEVAMARVHSSEKGTLGSQGAGMAASHCRGLISTLFCITIAALEKFIVLIAALGNGNMEIILRYDG
ncbi:jg1397 [Pararge aegeria aegeria]|uniref:Jg1397 protein n=1 Tax=Pararge aegeria aegeria TaxID=348720 RepID=A0A8S4QPK8_9NEOP|nr:jg1397 [Pararge aegeria aegeria]